MSVVAIFLVVVGELMSIAVILAAVAAVANIARLLHDLARVYGNGTRQLGVLHCTIGAFGTEACEVPRAERVHYVPGIACFIEADTACE
eukprot:XP_001707234.1 Hypothetical protein GL50803_36766 [Giardia lamblia ATCC 50803]